MMSLQKRVSKRSARTSQIITTLAEDKSLDFTLSAEGMSEPAIFMHGRMGIRIEMNPARGKLVLWISPQAGKEIDYRYRNFSCRDDHTSIFDEILFPELPEKKFLGCDYDPFHSILQFEGQKIHLLSLFEYPAILVWCESEEVIDFKSDKQDSIIERNGNEFIMLHPDRGEKFCFMAMAPGAEPCFIHQPEVDKGRSTYARAVLQPNRVLLIGGELEEEDFDTTCRKILRSSLQRLIEVNEEKIRKELKPSTLIIKDQREMQKLYEMNKRHLLSAQDASGAIRAALKYVYYLIWSTDGTVTSAGVFQAGWKSFLEKWLEFLLSNPTKQKQGPKGRFYGQLVNGVITKREEFGSLCAVWPAFAHWAQTGDRKFVSGKYLKVLEDVVDWLDQYCFDPEVGGLGTFYIGGGNEDPFFGSTDYGWDAAVGKPMMRKCYTPTFEGEIILRAYEFNMNLNQYNMHAMLAIVTHGERSKSHLKKSETYRKFLERLLSVGIKGYYQLQRKGLTEIPYSKEERPCGLFAVQSKNPAFFMPEYARLFMNRMESYRELETESLKNQMPCSVYGLLAGLDTEFVDEDSIFRSLVSTLPYNVHSTPLMPMAYTMVETLGAAEGTYNDIRPQAFSAGPFQAAVANLAFRMLPFGLAVRASNHMSAAKNISCYDTTINMEFVGSGKVMYVEINGERLEYTLQLPVRMLRGRSNRVVVHLGEEARTPVLVHSTVRLLEIQTGEGFIAYLVDGYLQNVLVMRNANGKVRITDEHGKEISYDRKTFGKHTFIEFSGHGTYKVWLEA